MEWQEALPLLRDNHTGVASSVTSSGRAQSTVVSTAVLDGKVGFASRGTLLMHELGHAAGLGHVLKRPGQMMSYKSTTKYEAGDLGGLHEVGKAQGCMLPLQGASRLAPPPVPEPEDHAHH